MISSIQVTGLFTALNIVLLVAALTVCCKSWLRMRAQYTMMLMILIGLFLAQNVISAYYFLTMMDFYAPDVATHVMILAILQTAAFSTLLWMEMQ